MSRTPSTVDALKQATDRLCRELDGLAFSNPTACVYNPLVYARAPHDIYLERFGQGQKRILMLGMNPGPYGMVQTGVPFGEIAAVRDWMGIEAPIGKPDPEHPKRPVDGFDCIRSEVSGRRLWGHFAGRFGNPEAFFAEHFVVNYCPLVWMEAGGKNRTPDKLSAAEMAPVTAACDRYLSRVLEVVEPEVRRRILPGKSELSLERYYEAFADAVAVFGRGEVSTYLLAGLGDSQEALLACSRRLIELGVYPFVVPFVPISGTPLESHPSPNSSFMVDVYQGVAEMLKAGDLRSEQMSAGCAKCGACSALSLFEQVS